METGALFISHHWQSTYYFLFPQTIIINAQYTLAFPSGLYKNQFQLYVGIASLCLLLWSDWQIILVSIFTSWKPFSCLLPYHNIASLAAKIIPGKFLYSILQDPVKVSPHHWHLPRLMQYIPKFAFLCILINLTRKTGIWAVQGWYFK